MGYEWLALAAASLWAIAALISVKPARHLGAFAYSRWRMFLVSLMLASASLVTGGWQTLTESALPLLAPLRPHRHLRRRYCPLCLHEPTRPQAQRSALLLPRPSSPPCLGSGLWRAARWLAPARRLAGPGRGHARHPVWSSWRQPAERMGAGARPPVVGIALGLTAALLPEPRSDHRAAGDDERHRGRSERFWRAWAAPSWHTASCGHCACRSPCCTTPSTGRCSA